MAYFFRDDERNPLILCNICDVKCSENALVKHRLKCAKKHADKFTNGELVRCEYDPSHIMKPDQMPLHLEFCLKHQNQLKEEYQRALTEELKPRFQRIMEEEFKDFDKYTDWSKSVSFDEEW